MKRAAHRFMCLLASAFTAGAHAAPMLPDTACATVKKAVANRFGVPESGPPGAGWFCDVTPERDSTLFIVALRSAHPQPGTSTNLLGWFAVDRASGKLFKWDEKARRTFVFDAVSGRTGKP